MEKIMFNTRYGLEQAVLSESKTQTRRIALNGTPFGNWSETVKKSKYQEGEVVAVAQSYKKVAEFLARKGYDVAKWMDNNHITKNMAGWLNKMFVRADLMVFKIRLTNVRMERLHDISDEDCMAEGIQEFHTPTLKRYGFSDFNEERICFFYSAREAYAALIDNISGKGTWQNNPYVFVYDFDLVK